MPSLDIVTWHSPIRNCLGAPRAQLFFHGRTPYRLESGKDKKVHISWKNQLLPLKSVNIKAAVFEKQHAPLIKAVATVEPSCLVSSENDIKHTSNLQFRSNSQLLLLSDEDKFEMDEKETLRRSRISKANKGNVPWNKGRKHSPETLQRIRERTKLAMQDPKVKMKLVNIGHAQSEETRAKIGVGVREGWQRRREKLLVQETCCIEWQDHIAESARKGYEGQEELQWDSYEILDKELRKAWVESVEKRKTMPRPKGSKRAPKSLEQRRKISASISAMWADPGYRERVCSALAKYHGVSSAAERKPRVRRTVETQPTDRVRVRNKPREPEGMLFDAKIIKKPAIKGRKNAAPMYRDPMASTKLEMIKKIKAQRTEMENKKLEAIERAKLLIAEAEKAAQALEVPALTSPLAHASLLETRKLIAEATLSIESIENGEIVSQDTSNSTSPNWDGKIKNPPGSPETPHVNNNTRPVEPRVNGSCQLPLSEKSTGNFEFDKFTLENVVNGSPMRPTEAMEGNTSPLLQLNNMQQNKDAPSPQVGILKLNPRYEHKFLINHKKQEEQTKKTDGYSSDASSGSSITKTKKKWVCGRLVEVQED